MVKVLLSVKYSEFHVNYYTILSLITTLSTDVTKSLQCKGRETERDTHRKKHTERDRERQRETERQRERLRETERQRDRERHRETQREREERELRDTERQRQREERELLCVVLFIYITTLKASIVNLIRSVKIKKIPGGYQL